MKKQEQIANMGLEIKSEFIPWSRSRSKQYGREPNLNWKVTVILHGKEILTTDFLSGQGYCPSYRQNGNRQLIEWECENGKHGWYKNPGSPNPSAKRPVKHILPNICDVLHCLILDAEVLEYPAFEEWAKDIGYDTDSRKAEEVYKRCLTNSLRFFDELGRENFDKLRDILKDH